jgi:transcriptional regulator with XRE-family HTH domain
MTADRKNPIPEDQLDIIIRVGKKLKEMRKENDDLSVERFCVKNDIPRITYGNLENGKSSFQITTLLTVLKVYDMDLATFFKRVLEL